MASNYNDAQTNSILEAADSTMGKLLFPIHCPNSNFTSRIKDLWQDDVFCDITLSVDGKQFNCHKIILAANSPYFHSLLSNGMSETSKKVVELKDISSHAMENILNYIYFKNTSIGVTEAIEMLKTVDMLQIDNSLRSHLMNYLIKHVADDNCLDILNLTSCIKLPGLWKVAKEHALTNFKTVWRTDGLLDLSKDVLSGYLGDDGLLLDKEENIFNSVCRWIEADFQMRKQYAGELFKTVRFCFIEPNILIDDIEVHPFMEEFSSLRKHVMTALRHQTTPCYQHQEHYYKCKPRMCNITICLVNPRKRGYNLVGRLTNKNSPVCVRKLSYDTINSREHINISKISRSCLVGRTLFVCDGTNLCKYTFNQETGPYPDKGWQKCTNRTQQGNISEFTFTLCGDYIYLIGGEHHETGVSSIIDTYNWQKDLWEVPDGFGVALLHPVRSHTAVSLNSSIYIFGGSNAAGKISKFLQIYNTRDGRISMGPMMLHSQYYSTAVCYNDEIYSFSSKQVMKYTPAESKWTQLSIPLPPLAIPMVYPSATVFGKNIFIFGGLATKDQADCNTFEYDITKDSYTKVNSFKPAFMLDGIATLVHNNHLKWL
ncbi:unnamed protein product [Owenia fusiformis]|uniref:Uncharacterized protein n=1 Tax=Owenia fusiformis TaxID=6347 RepID=A0A8J1XVS4_OWEFU|nr:unnamed protein product [Owenia fusiformis]